MLLILWAVVTAVLTWFTPNLDHIINQRGNMTIEQSYPSQVAQKMIDSMSSTKGDTGLLVFYDKNTLSGQDLNAIKAALKDIKGSEDSLGITGIVDSFDVPDAKSQMVSKDNTTMIAQFTYEKNGRDTQVIVNELESHLKSLKVDNYITGSDFISNDYLKQTDSGVEKSAIITVLFILVVLVLMFRSVVAPLVSLFSVGIAYLASMGIVGQLIDKLGFPVTSLTRMFLILILFGIGTDYNILLFNRFKEELKNHVNVDDAISATYKTAGRTVIFSATTIFIAFMALNFVKFSVYRSGVAVAIGIMVLVVELMTLTPALFRILGKRMFWPSKNAAEHRQSKTWEKAVTVSTKHPAIAMIVIAVLILPVLIVGSYKMSFDNLQDMGNNYPSVMGFNTVATHFSKGTTMPTTVVIQSSKPMDNGTDLAVIDGLTEKIRKVKGVNSVMGPTQPQGSEISDFYLSSQTGQVVSGMTSADGGLSQISSGLDTMKNELSVPDLSQVGQLADSTSQIQSGMQSLTGAINQANAGLSEGASGADRIADKIDEMKTSLATIGGTLDQLYSGYYSLEGGYEAFGQSMEQTLQTLTELSSGIEQTIEQNPDYYSALEPQMAQLNGSLSGLYSSFTDPNGQYNLTLQSFKSLNAGLQQASGGISQMTDGLSQLESGQRAMSAGLRQGISGDEEIAANMEQMTGGLALLSAGPSGARLHN
jgi:RND superfamily putative drug exporter